MLFIKDIIIDNIEVDKFIECFFSFLFSVNEPKCNPISDKSNPKIIGEPDDPCKV